MKEMNEPVSGFFAVQCRRFLPKLSRVQERIKIRGPVGNAPAPAGGSIIF